MGRAMTSGAAARAEPRGGVVAGDPTPDKVFQPIAIVRTWRPDLAMRMADAWGTPMFDDLVKALLRGPDGRPRGLPLELLNAILALERHHLANAASPGSINQWLPDPVRERR